MWRPPINFITLHYTYIVLIGILGLIIIYPYGNIAAVDAYFFGVSSSTESGLNTVDVKDLQIYQQLVLYWLPIVTNLGFINILVVVFRLLWFRKRMREHASSRLRYRANISLPEYLSHDAETVFDNELGVGDDEYREPPDASKIFENEMLGASQYDSENATGDGASHEQGSNNNTLRVKFANQLSPHSVESQQMQTLYIPSPRERERGYPFKDISIDVQDRPDEDNGNAYSTGVRRSEDRASEQLSRRPGSSLGDNISIERAASSIFVLGAEGKPKVRRRTSGPILAHGISLPRLSASATIGRNSNIQNLSVQDREALGGIEYRSLKLLLKIIVAYFFGLHIFGAICLAGWIQTAPAKYRDYLASIKQNKTWWGFYSAQTMVDNLGFTLTPDSMIPFQDAVFPMLIMIFLALAGNTFYPVFLRFSIWVLSKIMRKGASIQKPLHFLLEHPRRCYTLLFPSRPTWILFGILVVLNLVDLLVIILLDLHNPEVNHLSPGIRIVACLCQAASSRHTGIATFNIALINPAAQFSLLVMMYISVYPIAISVRASNSYEERSIGVYENHHNTDEDNSRSYVLSHIRNQLSFDLWYIFLGIFCICIAEADRIMDPKEPAFQVFAIFFEVVSAYGNVGLSLGYPTNLTSLSGHFTTFSKLVICGMMIRGRHRGLPYQIDRAIKLPDEELFQSDSSTHDEQVHGPE